MSRQKWGSSSLINKLHTPLFSPDLLLLSQKWAIQSDNSITESGIDECSQVSVMNMMLQSQSHLLAVIYSHSWSILFITDLALKRKMLGNSSFSGCLFCHAADPMVCCGSSDNSTYLSSCNVIPSSGNPNDCRKARHTAVSCYISIHHHITKMLQHIVVN